MLSGEPCETAADLRFRVFGFPVRVHPWFWLILSIPVGLTLAIVGLAAGDRVLMYFFMFLTYANAQALQSSRE